MIDEVRPVGKTRAGTLKKCGRREDMNDRIRSWMGKNMKACGKINHHVAKPNRTEVELQIIGQSIWTASSVSWILCDVIGGQINDEPINHHTKGPIIPGRIQFGREMNYYLMDILNRFCPLLKSFSLPFHPSPRSVTADTLLLVLLRWISCVICMSYPLGRGRADRVAGGSMYHLCVG